MKLGIYITFFFILLMFYGLPIHILRDLFMTARSFFKRLTAFLRYRRATSDMNKRYEDATVEDIAREDTCIICREDMRPWSVTNPQAPPAAPGGALPPARPASIPNERSRPKKLPCGHVLHLGCLKSWLERQQVCPTCREPVVGGNGARTHANNVGQPAQPPVPGQQNGVGAPAPPAAPGRRGMRMLNLGPLRVGFGQANVEDLAQNFGGPNQNNPAPANARIYGLELGFPRRQQPQPQSQAAVNTAGSTTQEQLQQIEQQIMSEIRTLQATQQELHLVQLMQVELARLRMLQGQTSGTDPVPQNLQMPQMPQFVPPGQWARGTISFAPPLQPQQMQRHGARNTSAIPAGSAELPPGVTIPEGWSLLPLQRLDGHTVTQTGTVPAGSTGLAPTATTVPHTNSPRPTPSNNITTSHPLINPETQSQTSSVGSSDMNAIHTPPSIIANQSNDARPIFDDPNNNTSTTTAPLPTSDPSEPPSLGGSQLFSAPGFSNHMDNVVLQTTPPPPPTFGDDMDIGQSSSISTETSSGQDSEERRRDKGKAKPVTMEDSVDESEEA